MHSLTLIVAVTPMLCAPATMLLCHAPCHNVVLCHALLPSVAGQWLTLMTTRLGQRCIWLAPTLVSDLAMQVATCGEYLLATLLGVIVAVLSCSHGMSYPISSNVRSYKAKGYNRDKDLIVSTYNTVSYHPMWWPYPGGGLTQVVALPRQWPYPYPGGGLTQAVALPRRRPCPGGDLTLTQAVALPRRWPYPGGGLTLTQVVALPRRWPYPYPGGGLTQAVALPLPRWWPYPGGGLTQAVALPRRWPCPGGGLTQAVALPRWGVRVVALPCMAQCVVSHTWAHME